MDPKFMKQFQGLVNTVEKMSKERAAEEAKRAKEAEQKAFQASIAQHVCAYMDKQKNE